MAKKKKILFPVAFMVLITAIYTLALASINAASIGIIEKQQELNTQKSILYTLDVSYESDEAIESLFESNITTHTYNDQTYYEYVKDNQTIGYVFPFSGKGLWGTISGFAAVSPEFDTLLGVDFIAHSETPGLGGRIDEEWFKDQFRGLSLEYDPALAFKPAEHGNIDAVTGATLTSNSVRDMLNIFIDDVKAAYEGGTLNE